MAEKGITYIYTENLKGFYIAVNSFRAVELESADITEWNYHFLTDIKHQMKAMLTEEFLGFSIRLQYFDLKKGSNGALVYSTFKHYT